MNIFVQAYNTELVKKEELPKNWEDLADARWKGKLGIEQEDSDWLAGIYSEIGEKRAGKVFKQISATNGVSIRKGHTLLTQLVASGEVPLALTVYNYKAEQLRRQGAPISWFTIGNAIARPNGVGVMRRAPHPHAAVLFYDFELSEEGQKIFAEREFVPTSRKIDTPLNKIPMTFVDPRVTIDEYRQMEEPVHGPLRRSAMNQSALSGARVLVIGASGCLGGRLVERLVRVWRPGSGARSAARSAASIARLPIEVMIGDVLDPHAVTTSAQGCAVVFNCARNREPDPMLQRAVDVDGAGHVVDAARRAGARVVHVSSVRVYDRPSEGVLDESTRPVPKGEDLSSDDKLEGEQIALARGAQYGVPVVVIQPAIVYGPNAHYTLEMLSDLRTGRVILVNGGVGICNVVYVDDAVTALLLAATNDRAHGERFLISGPEHPTWAQFVGAFEAMLGVHRTVSLSERDALCLWNGRPVEIVRSRSAPGDSVRSAAP